MYLANGAAGFRCCQAIKIRIINKHRETAYFVCNRCPAGRNIIEQGEKLFLEARIFVWRRLKFSYRATDRLFSIKKT